METKIYYVSSRSSDSGHEHLPSSTGSGIGGVSIWTSTFVVVSSAATAIIPMLIMPSIHSVSRMSDAPLLSSNISVN